MKFTRWVTRLARLSIFLVLGACGGGGSGTVPVPNPAQGVISADGKTGTVTDVSGKPVTVAASKGSFTQLARSAQPTGATTGLSFPNGFFTFTVSSLTAGDTIQVTVTLPTGSNPTSIVKCVSDTSCSVFPGAAISGNTVILTLKDGGAGDADGVANGVISDPFGPATSTGGTITTPGAPTNLSATPGNQQVNVAFIAPTSNGGAAVTNYEYSLNDGAFTALSPAITAPPAIITGLTNGATYSIKLRAVNSAGSGTASAAVSGTPYTTPAAPTGLTPTAGNRQVSVAFTAPADNGGAAISNYEYSTDGGATFTGFNPAVLTSPVTITGLTNGTPYTITLRALNAGGAGTASAAVSATPFTTASAPTGLNPTPGDKQVVIAFNMPMDNGGSAITNYLFSTDGGTTFTAFNPVVTSSPATITGLTNGTSYSIALKALNAAGAGAASTAVSATPVAVNGCAETGVSATFACKSGSTEPLYTYQWALNYLTSYFKDFPAVFDAAKGTDLNVEGAHAKGIKGQGVVAMVLDDGVDVSNEDLIPNLDRNKTFNFDDGSNNSTPADVPANKTSAHGTHVAGIIAAAQNGKGIMGIAPRVTLGGARFLGPANASTTEAYGGAAWSKDSWVINASYGSNPEAPVAYDADAVSNPAIRNFPNLRSAKGLVYVKASGNEFDGIGTRSCPDAVKGTLSCENPAGDLEALEPNVILVAAANAKGIKSSYSNGGSVNWITGMGGEFGDGDKYGETGSGPTIFSTDLVGCVRGYSRTDATDSAFLKGTTTANGVAENQNCDYGYMNGTSAATPTITGVISLILSANPNLTWRDAREILRATAKKIDANYGSGANRGKAINLASGQFTVTDATTVALADGAVTARLDYGWQKNSAGYDYSNWYGFGVADAAAAVAMAKATSTFKPATLTIPPFTAAFADTTQFKYGQVQKLGQFTVTGAQKVDELQLRVTGSVCIGSTGFFVKSPSGLVSVLSVPYNIYYKTGVSAVANYALGSFAFYGEPAAGAWEIYAVNAVPITTPGDPGVCSNYNPQTGTTANLTTPLKVEYRIIAAQ